MKSLERYLTPQNIVIGLAVLAVLMIWGKIKNLATTLADKFSPAGVSSAIAQGTKNYGVAVASNPITQGILTGIATKAATAASAQAAKTAATQAAYNGSTASRVERANQLKKEFLAKRYLRFKLLETVNAEIVKFDAFGAVVMVGKQKRLPKGVVIERPMGFFSTITLKGNLVLTDIQANVQYAVNPHLLTLV